MNERLKKLIFKKLYEDLFQVEIIHYNESIWFIDRKKKYWYFEYNKLGTLWYRYGFFTDFFQLFCLQINGYEPIICEWVEEVLNCKVNTPILATFEDQASVEEVLNCKVNTPDSLSFELAAKVEEVLNYKVNTPHGRSTSNKLRVEEVLNCKVNTPLRRSSPKLSVVEEVLNCKVTIINATGENIPPQVEQKLN